jgi:hypothetical protein
MLNGEVDGLLQLQLGDQKSDNGQRQDMAVAVEENTQAEKQGRKHAPQDGPFGHAQVPPLSSLSLRASSSPSDVWIVEANR